MTGTKVNAISAQIDLKRRTGRPEGFAAEVSRITGCPKSSINRHIRRAKMICKEARDLIKRTKLDKGTYLDALIKMDLTDAGQVAKVRSDLAHGPKPPKTRMLRQDDGVDRVVDALRALYDEDVINQVVGALLEGRR